MTAPPPPRHPGRRPAEGVWRMRTAVEQAAMRRAIALSAAVLGRTNPNPAVGCVLLDPDGAVLAEGATAPAGGPHAEVAALAAAGSAAAGATAVVTLEPCRHAGRTGPCTAALLAAGVRRVVYALADPHPQAGGGAGELAAAGVEVSGGLLAAEADAVLGPWRTAVARGRPFVTYKYAASLDGRVAAADGTSRWVSGSDSRTDVHRLRALADAVAVGVGTVAADNPRLTVRDAPASRQPARVVLDPNARTPLSAAVLDGEVPTFVAVADGADPDRVRALRGTPAELLLLPRAGGTLDLPALCAELSERSIHLLLLEGGPTVAGAFLRAGLVDRVVAYLAPLLLGTGPAALGDAGVATLAAAPRWQLDAVDRIGADVRLVAVPAGVG